MTDDLCKAGIMIEEMAKKASEGDCGEKDGSPPRPSPSLLLS